ncbi:hypothetical protein ACJ8J4_15895 [Serratia sp. CY47280]|uniref:hypothetical protein n=1 Tax=Serratia sp. CY47280 TaxID=3383625 RepID=UPI003FA0DAE5
MMQKGFNGGSRTDELALKRIFEAGVFYNAALTFYRDDIKLIDNFIDKYDHCEKEVKDKIGGLIFIYMIEKDPQQEMLFFQAMHLFTMGADIVFAARDLKAKLMLPWPPFYLSKTEREILRPDILLDAFLALACAKKGFKSITGEDVRQVAEKYSLLKHFREGNHFFQHRVKLNRNSNDGSIHIFYNREIVTFRKSLIYALENIKHQLGHDLLANKWSAKNMSSLGGMLLAQAYLYTKDIHGLSQEAYFERVTKSYPAMMDIGLRDKKSIYGGMRKLEELESVFIQNYEVDDDELTAQHHNFNHTNRNHAEIDARISPSVLLKSSLSLYINYYTFILSHVDFIKSLYKLKQSIKDIVIRQFKQKEFVVFDILNRINKPVEQFHKDSFSDIFQAVETQCHGMLRALRLSPEPQDSWGHLTCNYIVPELSEIIHSLGMLHTLCNQNYQHVTYDNLKSLNLDELFKKSLIINRIIELDSKFICAGYGLSDHTIVLPMNAPQDVYGSIRAALDLYDKNAKNYYLSSTIIYKDIEKLQCVLWGLYHLYQKSFSSNKITNEMSIDNIGQFYQQTISESRFRMGKKTAQELIISYQENKDLSSHL